MQELFSTFFQIIFYHWKSVAVLLSIRPLTEDIRGDSGAVDAAGDLLTHQRFENMARQHRLEPIRADPRPAELLDDLPFLRALFLQPAGCVFFAGFQSAFNL